MSTVHRVLSEGKALILKRKNLLTCLEGLQRSMNTKKLRWFSLRLTDL